MRNRYTFVCLTTYQLFISYSYIKEIKKKTNDECFVIWVEGINKLKVTKETMGCDEVIIIPNLFDHALKRFWKRLYYSGNLFKFSRLRKILDDKVNSTLVVFNDTEPITSKLMKELKKNQLSRIVLVEEGIGLYNSVKVNAPSTLVSKAKHVFTSLAGNEIKYHSVGEGKDIDAIILRQPELLTENKSKEKSVIRQSIGGLFSNEIVTDFITNMGISNQSTTQEVDNKKTILFLGQPMGDLDVPGKEMEFMETLFSSFPKTIDIIIKPHPRDDLHKYKVISEKFHNVRVIQGEFALVPVECLFSLYKDSIVITYTSSAGINAKYIVPNMGVCFVYRCYSHFKDHTLPSTYNDPSDIIKDLMGENCVIAESIEEVASFINNRLKVQEESLVKLITTEFDGGDIEYFLKPSNLTI